MSESAPNLRHLMLLVAVWRTGSISAAARSFHLTQPAVTQAVASLERVFGSTLFVRGTRRMEPTTAGALCAGRVERAVQRITGALRTASRATRGTNAAAPRVSTGQLAALAAAVDAGGFGAAARATGVTRATIHRPVRRMERELGVPLFETTSHGNRPTREAVRLALEYRLALREISQARAEVASAAGVERGGTVIGAMPLARSGLVPAAVLRFAFRHPQHAVSILDGPYQSMLEALRSGQADVLVGALRDQTSSDVQQEHLFDDPLTIVARRGHPLALERSPRPEHLVQFPWIAPRAGSPLRHQFDRLMAAGRAEPPATPIECNSLVAARAILLASDRLMLLSAHQVQYELAAGEVTLLAHPFGRVTRTIGVTTRIGWSPTRVQADLLAAIREEGIRASTGGTPATASRDRRGRGTPGAKAPAAG